MKTVNIYKDKKGREIKEDDIVVVGNGDAGFIFKAYDGEFWVAWDLAGPSCEDSTPVSEFTEDKYSSIKVVGTMNR